MKKGISKNSPGIHVSLTLLSCELAKNCDLLETKVKFQSFPNSKPRHQVEPTKTSERASSLVQELLHVTILFFKYPQILLNMVRAFTAFLELWRDLQVWSHQQLLWILKAKTISKHFRAMLCPETA